jgi:nitroreductase
MDLLRQFMTCLTPLLTRHSTPSRLLGEPGPDTRQLEAMLRAAVHVPDHGRLTPWRFLRITGDARHALGQLLAERSRERTPDVPAAVVEKDRHRFSHAPLIIAVIGRLTPGHKIPEQEQLLSGGAVCFSLLLAAQAHGFSAQWLTGWAAYDPVITRRLGLGENERVLGFIHIGTPKEETPDRLRPEPSDLLSDWNPA